MSISAQPTLDELMDALRSTGLFDRASTSTLTHLANAATLVEVGRGDLVVRQGEPSSAMYLVASGTFDVVMELEQRECVVGEVRAGELIGEVQLLTGGRRTATVRASEPGRLLRLDKRAVDREAADNPEFAASLIEVIDQRLLDQQLHRALAAVLGDPSAEILHELRENISWLHLRRGEFLFQRGDDGDAAFLVVSGELLVISDAVDQTVFGSIHTGELVGEISLLAPGARTATVVAARDSRLVRVSRDSFNAVVSQRPKYFAGLVRVLVQRIRDRGNSSQKRHTIAVLPLSDSVPCKRLVANLRRAMSRFGECPTMTAADARTRGLLRRPRELADDSPAWMRLSLWLNMRQRDCEHVLLVGDPDDTPWTRRIAAEADQLLLVADPQAESALTAVETAVARLRSGAVWDPRMWLLFAHPADTKRPSGTANWLAQRDIDLHVHVRMDDREHIERLARMLADRAIGLVLSGGGALGYAHVGLYRAWRELGLPIDCVAGTSAGSLIGVFVADGREPAEISQQLQATFAGISSPFGDFTLPMMAISRGHRMRQLTQATYGDGYLEDLWLPFFATCTNLTQGAAEYRQRGLIWPTVLASSSPPPIVPPVIIDGDLYCDGGTVDNLPIAALGHAACGFRLASYIGTDSSVSAGAATELPSPWSMAWDRMVRNGEQTAGLPNIAEIAMRVMTLGDSRRLVESRALADLFFEPRLDGFDLLDFDRPAPIIDAGYQHARVLLAEHELVNRIRALVV